MPQEPPALSTVVRAVGRVRSNAPVPAHLKPSFGRLLRIPARYAAPARCIGHDFSRTVATPICRIGAPAGEKVIVLMGDSHAMMWLPALLEVARWEHWTLVPLLRLGCTPGKWTGRAGSAWVGCRRWYAWALEQVARLRPDVTLLGGSIDDHDTPWAQMATGGLLDAAEALRPLGRVVVIGDPEGLDHDPIECLRSSTATLRDCATTWPRSSLRGYDTVSRGATALGAGFLPTRSFVCLERTCPAVVGGTIVWRDANHLTFAYPAEIAPAFRLRLLGAISEAHA